jgi:transcriptional regulator with XRE-family HTH domain
MGRSRRPRPKHLGRKLKAVRKALRLSIAGMAERLDYAHPAHISGFESGKREPSLPVIVKYAELAGYSTDYLIDDRLELPVKRCKKIARVMR